MATLTIAAFAKAGGVGVETVRYYQRRGLLPTPALSGGNALSGGIRRYGESDVQRLRFIRSAQTAGFTLEEIDELLQLDAGLDRTRARELAKGRLAALDAKIAELQVVRTSLQRLAKACSETSAGPCPIISAFNA